MIRLLIVEDEQVDRKFLQDILENKGYDVTTAKSGKEALLLVKKKNPHIVFLDINLKDANGLDILKQIKDKNKAIAVIMVSVERDENTVKKAKALGATEYIKKPIDVDELERIVLENVNRIDKDQIVAEDLPVVFVVDDDKTMCDTIVDFNSRQINAKFHKFYTGKDALDMLKKESCDIMILDISMPGLSGISVIKKVKSMKPDIDIIAISSWESEEVIKESLGKGAVDFVPKPFESPALFDCLKRHLIKKSKFFPVK